MGALVLFLRILAVLSLAGASAAGIVTCISGVNKRKRIKQEKTKLQKLTHNNELEQVNEEENTTNLQNQLEEIIPAVQLNNEYYDSYNETQSTGELKHYEFGNLKAEFTDNKWMNFIQDNISRGNFEKSTKQLYQDNLMVYDKNKTAVLKLQGFGEELQSVIKTAPINQDYSVVYYSENQEEAEQNNLNNLQSQQEATTTTEPAPKQNQTEDKELGE